MSVGPTRAECKRGAAEKKMTDETWGLVQRELRNTIGQNNYQTWIEPLEFSDLSDGVVTFFVPSQFVGNWVSQRFGDHILHEIVAAGEPARRLAFRVRPAANDDVAVQPKKRPPQMPAAEKLPGAPLDDNFTFDSFVVGKPNELAHAAARRVGEGGPATFNPLFLYGGVGLGKTHLMHAIAWELKSRDPQARVLYLSAEQFMYKFVQALREKTMMDFKQIFRSVDVLMVDDVQFIAGKDSTQEEFFHTFNALVDQRKQIVISADCAPGEIEGLEGRIASRLQQGLVVDVHPTNYELRLGILQQKVEQYRNSFADARIGSGVLEFLAHKITTNVRVLEGALMRLFAFGSLIGREIDVAATKECLTDILKTSDKRATIDEIQRKVSDHYNIRLSDMLGPKRTRVYARPRQIAMFLCKRLTERSLPEIGRHFGGRDHTTILHGIKRIESLRETDRQVAEDVELLMRALQGN
ncbi:chromosomal replication initiator protein DnaA [Rhodobacteraceae bacterium CCMM004]|nr:chromosomal replication initiator protein DnaA [Rhodobacteraceae bacterium CCMM004]